MSTGRIERQSPVLVLAAFLGIVGSLGPKLANADVQVNTYTTGAQWSPAVGMEPDGDFVVVWQSSGSGGTDSSTYSVQGQRYGSDGSAVGGEFQVNTYTTNGQANADVGVAGNGDFVVVWVSSGSAGTDTSSLSVQGQRFGSDGSALGGEFQVNTSTLSDQQSPSVGMESDGDFVIVWESSVSGGTDSSNTSIQGQRYGSDGMAVGGEFQVNTYTTSAQRQPSVGVDSAGDFVVVWHSYGSGGPDTSSYSLQGQRFSSDGMAVGGEFQVNTYTTSFQSYPSVGVDSDGCFVVVWESNGSSGTDSDSRSVQGQRYGSDGMAVGGEFQVNSYTTNVQQVPSVGVDSDGDFVVVWFSVGSSGTDSDSRSVQGQRYGSDGMAVGGELQVNSYTTNGQALPSVGIDSDGDFVVVWQSLGSGGTDTSGYSVQKSDPGFVPVELQSFTVE